jgi:VanZ family protein
MPPARSRWIALCGAIVLIAAIVASLIPAGMQLRTGLHWQVEHFLVYFVATSIFCLAWPRPFIVAGVMMAFSALLEALQGLTPDRTPDLPTALAAAAGALTAGVLAWLVIMARKLALARAKQI